MPRENSPPPALFRAPTLAMHNGRNQATCCASRRGIRERGQGTKRERRPPDRRTAGPGRFGGARRRPRACMGRRREQRTDGRTTHGLKGHEQLLLTFIGDKSSSAPPSEKKPGVSERFSRESEGFQFFLARVSLLWERGRQQRRTAPDRTTAADAATSAAPPPTPTPRSASAPLCRPQRRPPL